jgi:hypothetical protein
MKDKYGLLFQWWKDSTGKLNPIIREKNPPTSNTVLTFLDFLHKTELEGLIYDLDRALTHGRNVDERFDSDRVEHMNITYEYPNINVDDELLIPMQDMKDLINEWLLFIENKPLG